MVEAFGLRGENGEAPARESSMSVVHGGFCGFLLSSLLFIYKPLEDSGYGGGEVGVGVRRYTRIQIEANNLLAYANFVEGPDKAAQAFATRLNAVYKEREATILPFIDLIIVSATLKLKDVVPVRMTADPLIGIREYINNDQYLIGTVERTTIMQGHIEVVTTHNAKAPGANENLIYKVFIYSTQYHARSTGTSRQAQVFKGTDWICQFSI
ncbi:hypothetical protein LXL04_018631 [Taraxacum kok-saghyz]